MERLNVGYVTHRFYMRYREWKNRESWSPEQFEVWTNNALGELNKYLAIWHRPRLDTLFHPDQSHEFRAELIARKLHKWLKPKELLQGHLDFHFDTEADRELYDD